MENLYQKTVPEFVETNLQYTKQRFKIPTNTNKEFRNTRRIIIREAYKQLLSKLNGKNYIKNNFLDEDIYIIWKESFQKASNRQEKEWKARPIQS